MVGTDRADRGEFLSPPRPQAGSIGRIEMAFTLVKVVWGINIRSGYYDVNQFMEVFPESGAASIEFR